MKAVQGRRKTANAACSLSHSEKWDPARMAGCFLYNQVKRNEGFRRREVAIIALSNPATKRNLAVLANLCDTSRKKLCTSTTRNFMRLFSLSSMALLVAPVDQTRSHLTLRRLNLDADTGSGIFSQILREERNIFVSTQNSIESTREWDG